MGRRAGTFTLCVGSLSLLFFLLATHSLEGLGLPPQPLDPFKDSHLIRHRILAHLKELASSYMEALTTNIFSYPIKGCKETLDKMGKKVVEVQFPCSLQLFLEHGWTVEEAVLQGSLLKRGSPFRNSKPENIMQNVTSFIEKAMHDCVKSIGNFNLLLQVGTEDFLGGSQDDDICDYLTELQLQIKVPERRHPTSQRFKRTTGHMCNVCHPHPFRVNLSEFVSGFHPQNVGPDGLSELRYCVGDCLYPDCLEEPTPWLLLAILMHKKNSNFPAPSCDAVEFADLTGTLIQPDNASFRFTISNLMVTKCLCL